MAVVPLEVVALGAERERHRVGQVVQALRRDHDRDAPSDECADGYQRALDDVLRELRAG